MTTDTWIEDDSDVIDAIESAKAAWFEAHPECNAPTSELTDGDINESLGLPRGGALRPLADEFADWSKDDIARAVTRGLDNWWNRAEVRFVLSCDYNAAPPADRFHPATIDELRDISDEINSAEQSSLATDWSREAWKTDRELCDLAIKTVKAGLPAFVAQDEDGYYFAAPRGRGDMRHS